MILKREDLERELRKEPTLRGSALKKRLKAYLSDAGARSRDIDKEMTLDALCNLLELRGLEHSAGFYHYTSWSSFCKMILGTKDVKPYQLLLKSACKMNDADDKHCGRDVYFTSFSYGEDENLAMWQIYGKPKEETIRIRFPQSKILSWFIGRSAKKPEVHFSDVGYYCRRNGEDKAPVVYYRSKKVKIDEFGWFDSIRDGDPKRILFKRSGWLYEKEMRLSARSQDQRTDKGLAIDFRRPLEAVLADPLENITFGPWFDRDEARKALSKILVSNPKADPATIEKLEEMLNITVIDSVYRGTVRSLCDECEYRCEYKSTCEKKVRKTK